ncbi:MAG: VCBS repeat-containing protein [Proteobacteria bacterium]|nr:VCBS repeat-containing protein [Pseudomonadota bacterium]
MTKPVTNRLFFVLVLLTGLLHTTLAMAESERILVFPFSIHSETPMDFLKSGLGDLIETQLSAKGFTVVRSDKETDKAEAIKQASEQSMDSLVMGSLTFLGERISINTFWIDTATGKTRIAFSRIEPDKEKLFEDMEAFTDQIHPEKNDTVASPPAQAIAPLPVKSDAPSSALTGPLVRSPRIEAEINAVAIGDVNGDGKKQIVVTDRHSIFIEHFQEGVFSLETRLEGKSYLINLFVDTFDSNHNGIDEIIVSAVHSRSNQVSSYAYEWDGKTYALIYQNMDFFFRTGKRPDTGERALLGQQQYFTNKVFDDKIMTMGRDTAGKSYIPIETCAMPDKNLNIYAFDTADIFNKGSLLTLTYTPSDYLKILDFKGEESWLSSDRYGGSNKFTEPLKQTDQERMYFSVRIMAGDFDKNGKIDVVTLLNKNSSPRMFSNLKNFVEGSVECMTWDTLGFKTQWSTQKISGYIPDFYIDDVDSNGVNDLVYCLVPKKSSFIEKQISYIVVQPITHP